MGQELRPRYGTHHTFQLLQEHTAIIGEGNFEHDAAAHKDQDLCQPVFVTVTQYIINKGLGQYRKDQSREKQKHTHIDKLHQHAHPTL